MFCGLAKNANQNIPVVKKAYKRVAISLLVIVCQKINEKFVFYFDRCFVLSKTCNGRTKRATLKKKSLLNLKIEQKNVFPEFVKASLMKEGTRFSKFQAFYNPRMIRANNWAGEHWLHQPMLERGKIYSEFFRKNAVLICHKL